MKNNSEINFKSLISGKQTCDECSLIAKWECISNLYIDFNGMRFCDNHKRLIEFPNIDEFMTDSIIRSRTTTIELYQPLYDTLYISKEVPVYNSFFSVPRGQSATLLDIIGKPKLVTKDYFHTNMDSVNMITTKLYKFDKFIFEFMFSNPGETMSYQENDLNQKDLEKFINNTFFQFRVVDQDIFKLPLRSFYKIHPLKLGVQIKVPIIINPFENITPVVRVKEGLILNSDFNLMLSCDGFMKRSY